MHAQLISWPQYARCWPIRRQQQTPFTTTIPGKPGSAGTIFFKKTNHYTYQHRHSVYSFSPFIRNRSFVLSSNMPPSATLQGWNMQDWKIRHQTAVFSSPAYSTPAFSMVPHFPVLHFQSLMGTLKMRDWNMQDWKMRHQIAGVEYAGLENTAPNCRGWNMQDWKIRHQLGTRKVGNTASWINSVTHIIYKKHERRLQQLVEFKASHANPLAYFQHCIQ